MDGIIKAFTMYFLHYLSKITFCKDDPDKTYGYAIGVYVLKW
jgi:hypothetical protein